MNTTSQNGRAASARKRKIPQHLTEYEGFDDESTGTEENLSDNNEQPLKCKKLKPHIEIETNRPEIFSIEAKSSKKPEKPISIDVSKETWSKLCMLKSKFFGDDSVDSFMRKLTECFENQQRERNRKLVDGDTHKQFTQDVREDKDIKDGEDDENSSIISSAEDNEEPDSEDPDYVCDSPVNEPAIDAPVSLKTRSKSIHVPASTMYSQTSPTKQHTDSMTNSKKNNQNFNSAKKNSEKEILNEDAVSNKKTIITVCAKDNKQRSENFESSNNKSTEVQAVTSPLMELVRKNRVIAQTMTPELERLITKNRERAQRLAKKAKEKSRAEGQPETTKAEQLPKSNVEVFKCGVCNALFSSQASVLRHASRFKHWKTLPRVHETPEADAEAEDKPHSINNGNLFYSCQHCGLLMQHKENAMDHALQCIREKQATTNKTPPGTSLLKIQRPPGTELQGETSVEEAVSPIPLTELQCDDNISLSDLLKMPSQGVYKKYLRPCHIIDDYPQFVKYSCTKCDEEFSTKKQASRHITKSHKNENKVRIQTDMLQEQHTIMPRWRYGNGWPEPIKTIGKDLFKCGACYFVRKTFKTVIEHIQEFHGDHSEVNIIVIPSSSKKKYAISKHKYYAHCFIQDESKYSKVPCDECETTSHYKIQTQNGRESRRNLYKCDSCSFACHLHSGIERHLQMHKLKPTKNFQTKTHDCSHCSHTSRRKVGLWKHIKENHPETIRCSTCDKTYKDMDSLHHHSKIAHSAKLDLCEICGMHDINMQHLAKCRTNYRLGPRKCPHCKFQSINRAAVATHICQSHQKRELKAKKEPLPKIHICAICGKGFVYKDQLKIHLNNFHRESSLSCPWEGCNKTFKWKTSLLLHLKWHKGDIIECSLCDYKTVRKDNIKKHLIKKHDIHHFEVVRNTEEQVEEKLEDEIADMPTDILSFYEDEDS